jgi:hypothetical protein
MSVVACAVGEAPISYSSVTTSSQGGGGAGGSDLGPCGMDCSTIKTEQCTIAVCNTGQELGPINTCVVIPAPKGTSCDDGKFCTVNDTCDNGECVGGTPNDCGTKHSPCEAVICYEDMKSCDVTPVDDGSACEPTDLCQTNGVCHLGQCLGQPKDCSFSPLNECNKVTCEPSTGKCVGTPDPTKDENPCVLSGPLCSVNKTCQSGQCQGGTPKDCSALNVGCQVGVCQDDTGQCHATPAPVGTSCSDGIAECHVGTCDVKGVCTPSAGLDGVACNDHNACTKSDTCSNGTCSGSAVSGCVLYFQEGFETCPDGWTLAGDWQCGTPMNVGPTAPHTGTGVIATQIAGVYTINQSFNTCTADSPAIDLTAATSPVLSFFAWDHTEGGTFDGWNLKISTLTGSTWSSWTEVSTVTPAYPLTVLGQPSWGGDHSAEGWQNYLADLQAYAGHQVKLRFAFRSDAATVYPGVYLDDVVVAEPPQIPLYISTVSLPDVYAGTDYAAQVAKTGGSNNVVWKIVGGTNDNWMSIDSATGVLKGTPTPQQVGPVTVTVHVEEAALPSNFAEKTFSFNVNPDTYYTSFESCPNGWTLTGDWQCGVPTIVGPATAYVGSQCLATQISSNYHDLQSWSGSTATSPDIDLTNVPTPIFLTFRMWVDTEGSTYDGANLSVSTDGGMTYSVITNVTPPYPLMIGGEPAWGGHQSQLGWQAVKADLSAYAGQVIRLRFAFHSDSSGNFPGVYIDDVFID